METKFVKFDGKIFKLEPTPDGGAASFMLKPDGTWKSVSIGVFTEAEFNGEAIPNPSS